MSVLNHQKKICKKFGLSYEPCYMNQYLYVSKNIKNGSMPIEGKRYIEEDNFCGGYIWSGEELNEKGLFDKIIINDINEYSDVLMKFLGLERGTRFLIEADHIEAEFDYRVFNMID